MAWASSGPSSRRGDGPYPRAACHWLLGLGGLRPAESTVRQDLSAVANIIARCDACRSPNDAPGPPTRPCLGLEGNLAKWRMCSAYAVEVHYQAAKAAAHQPTEAPAVQDPVEKEKAVEKKAKEKEKDSSSPRSPSRKKSKKPLGR